MAASTHLPRRTARDWTSFLLKGVEVTQVDWVLPAAGDQKMIDLLEDLL
jgi:hypothetical protein